MFAFVNIGSSSSKETLETSSNFLSNFLNNQPLNWLLFKKPEKKEIEKKKMFQNLKPKCFKTSILVSILKDDSGALSASNSTIVTLFFKDSDFSGNSKVPPIHKNHKTHSCYNCRNVLTLS